MRQLPSRARAHTHTHTHTHTRTHTRAHCPPPVPLRPNVLHVFLAERQEVRLEGSRQRVEKPRLRLSLFLRVQHCIVHCVRTGRLHCSNRLPITPAQRSSPHSASAHPYTQDSPTQMHVVSQRAVANHWAKVFVEFDMRCPQLLHTHAYIIHTHIFVLSLCSNCAISKNRITPPPKSRTLSLGLHYLM